MKKRTSQRINNPEYPPIMNCLKCGISKKRKEFQRESKIYRSCNDCSFNVKRLIDNSFKLAFFLFNSGD